MTKSSAQSVEELEIKVAFIEESIVQLSDEFYRQQRELEDLKGKYASLISKLDERSNSESHTGEILDEPPPHY